MTEILTDTFLKAYYYIRYRKNTCLIIYTEGNRLWDLNQKYPVKIRDNIKGVTVLSINKNDVRNINCHKSSKSFYNRFLADEDMCFLKVLK